MSKEAKGFALEDINEKGSTFELNENGEPKSDGDTIFLDIIGDETIPLAGTSNSTKSIVPKSRKTDFYRAYRRLHSAFTIKRKVPDKERSVFFELMSTMLGAGISVIQAVKVFTEQTNDKYFKKITQAITYQLEKGQSLSQAMAEYPHIFSESECGMVEAAEASGRLNEVLMRLSQDIEANILIKSKIKSAMIYPAIVFAFVVLVLYGMLRFVIPQITELFAQTGLELPGITKLIIAMSDFVIANGLLMGIFGIASIGLLLLVARSKEGKKLFYAMSLHIPVLKDFQKSISQATFSRSLSNLLSAGISVVRAVEITAKSVSNVIYREKINLIAKDVSQGIPIAESIQDSPYFSNLLQNMIAVGEKTAQIDELAEKTAEYYENKVTTLADNFAKLIQPFIILVVGGMVGVVVLAIMLPMTRLLGGIDAL